MGPEIVIRADASPLIGTGHVMRCLALASAGISRGSRVRLIGRIESDEIQSRLTEMGIVFFPLEKTYPDPSDIEQTLKLLADGVEDSEKAPWLVLDGYKFDASYHEAVRQAGYRLLVVDDYNHLNRYACDILLNQNIGADRLEYKISKDTKLLSGPRFALLRSEFLSRRDNKSEIPEKAGHILVTMGGADPHNTTAKILEGLSLLNDPELEVNVVVGPANQHLPEIEQIVKKAPFTASVLSGVKDMASVMSWADLAVTAAGSTCYELALLGVPFVTVILAENQENIALYLQDSGVAPNIGWHQQFAAGSLARLVDDLLLDRLSRSDMIAKGRQLSDGNGADRVLAFIGSEVN